MSDCDCTPTAFRSSCPAHTIMRTAQFDQLHATLDVPDEAPKLTEARARNTAHNRGDMKTYTAIVERSTPGWGIYVPDMDRHTWAANLDDVTMMARDLIQVMTNEPLEGIAVDVRLPSSDVSDAVSGVTTQARICDVVTAELDGLEDSDVIQQRAYATSRPNHPDEGVTVTMHFTLDQWKQMQALANNERTLATQLRETIMMEFGI